MGRGLSPLQKFILVAALKKSNKLPGWDSKTCTNNRNRYGVLRPKDVLVGYYGFTPKSSDYSFNKQGAWDFKMSEVGEGRYRAAAVATRKAFLRLEKRGLVRTVNHHWQEYLGIELSPTGKELAEKIA